MNTRDELERLLRQGPHSLRELADRLELPIHVVNDHVEHLQRSLRHRGGRLHLHPARCRHCGFTFTQHRFTRPSRCPRCRSTWIEPPRLEITSGEGKKKGA